MPNNANVPLLKEEGETLAQAHFGATDDMNFIDLNAAHALGKNTAIMFNPTAFLGDYKPKEASSPPEIELNPKYCLQYSPPLYSALNWHKVQKG